MFIKAKPSNIVNWVREILIAEDEIMPYRPENTKKPTHGNCCTCQDCWWDHESCVCEGNRVNKIFDTMAEEADEYFK